MGVVGLLLLPKANCSKKVICVSGKVYFTLNKLHKWSKIKQIILFLN